MNKSKTDSNRDMKKQKQNTAHLPAEQETNDWNYQSTCTLSASTTAWPFKQNCLADLGVFNFYPSLHHRNHHPYCFWLSQVPRELTFSNLTPLVIPVGNTIWMSKSPLFHHYFWLPLIISMYPNVVLSQEYSYWYYCNSGIFCTIFPSLKLVNPWLSPSQLMSSIKSCV